MVLNWFGSDDLDLMAHGAALGRDPAERADDAVDLGFPGVGGQDDAHEGRLAPSLIGLKL